MNLFGRCSVLVRFGMIAVLAVVGASRAEAQPDPSLEPGYGSVKLRVGFTPDPHTKNLTAGGEIETNLGGLTAYVAKAPDYKLFYTAGALPLTILAESKGDTTLLINLPNGTWVADDDSGEGLNPKLHFAKPQSGRYDIYVGTISEDTVAATLKITELGGGPALVPPKDGEQPKERPLALITASLGKQFPDVAEVIQKDLRVISQNVTDPSPPIAALFENRKLKSDFDRELFMASAWLEYRAGFKPEPLATDLNVDRFAKAAEELIRAQFLSDPSGSIVYLRKSEIGKTRDRQSKQPLQWYVQVGRHAVEFRKAGFETAIDDVDITPENRIVDRKLRPE